jgi:hypothetical protein
MGFNSVFKELKFCASDLSIKKDGIQDRELVFCQALRHWATQCSANV